MQMRIICAAPRPQLTAVNASGPQRRAAYDLGPQGAESVTTWPRGVSVGTQRCTRSRSKSTAPASSALRSGSIPCRRRSFRVVLWRPGARARWHAHGRGDARARARVRAAPAPLDRRAADRVRGLSRARRRRIPANQVLALYGLPRAAAPRLAQRRERGQRRARVCVLPRLHRRGPRADAVRELPRRGAGRARRGRPPLSREARRGLRRVPTAHTRSRR